MSLIRTLISTALALGTVGLRQALGTVGLAQAQATVKNALKKAEPPAPPAPTPEDVLLLRQIRDSLNK